MTSDLDIKAVSTIEELEELSAVLAKVWQVPDATQIYPAGTLRALEFAGNYICAAYRGGRMVGGAVAFLGDRGQLHSDVAGIVADQRGRGIGYAIKMHQRSWALERGITSIQWTFDPTLFVNARFNLHRLAAHAVKYLPDFYGRMDDGLNTGTGPSDRLLVDWRIDSPRVTQAMTARLAEPQVGTRVPVHSLQQLRRDLSTAFEAGAEVTAVTADFEYVVEPSP